MTRECIRRILEILLLFQTGFNLINAAVVCYPGEYLRLRTLISYNGAQVLEACDCLKLLSIYFDRCVDATGVVISLVLSALTSLPYSYNVEALSRHSTNFASSSSSPAKAKPWLSSAKWRLVIVLPPMLAVPS